MIKELLSTSDRNLCTMIEEFTGFPVQIYPNSKDICICWTYDINNTIGKDIKILQEAIKGKLGHRFHHFGIKCVYVLYDSENYSEELIKELDNLNPYNKNLYVLKPRTVKAIKVCRENIDNLIIFIDENKIEISLTIDDKVSFSFYDRHHKLINVIENDYIIRNDNGTFEIKDTKKFEEEYDPK